MISRLSREHSPVPDQFSFDRLSVYLDLDSAFLADLYQPPRSLVYVLMHRFPRDVPDILEKTTISDETDHNVCEIVALPPI